MLHLLHEHRMGVHVVAVRASGLTPLEAIIAGPEGETGAVAFGWQPPYPPAGPIVRRLMWAESVADSLAGQAYAPPGPRRADRARSACSSRWATAWPGNRFRPRGGVVGCRMTALPEGWTTRRPTLDDVPEILELVHASDIAAVGEPDFTVDEVRESLTDAEHRHGRGLLAGRGRRAARSSAGPTRTTPPAATATSSRCTCGPERGAPALRPAARPDAGRVDESGRRASGTPVYTVRAGAIPTETP